MGVVLSLLTAALIYLLLHPSTADEQQQRLPIPAPNIDRIRFRSRSGETVQLQRAHQGAPWKQRPQLSIFLSDERLQQLAQTLISLQGNPQGRPDVNEAQATTRANLYSGTALQLSLAFYAQGKEVLAIIPQKDQAYLISSTRFASITWSLRHLATPYLPIPKVDLGELQSIAIQTSQHQLDIHRSPDGDYFFRHPYANRKVAVLTLSRLLSPVNQTVPILALQFHPSPSTKVMSDPTLVTLFTRTTRVDLLLGQQTLRGIHARLPPHPEILLLPSSLATIKSIPPFALLDKKIYAPSPSLVSSASYQYNGASYSLRYNQETPHTFTSYLNGSKLSYEGRLNYLGYLGNLFYEEQIAGRFYPVGSPQGRLTYRLSHGTSTRIDFYSYPDTRYYAVSVDGERPHFLIGRYQLLRLAAISQVLTRS